MKIRPSLRLYFLAGLLALGSVMALTFSALTVRYYIEGMDSGLSGTMLQVADADGVSDGFPVTLLDFQIASRWQDVPAQIKKRFPSPPNELYQLKKSAGEHNLLSVPEEVYFVSLMANKLGEKRYVTKILTDLPPPHLQEQSFSHFFWIFVFAVSAILIFALLVLLIMRFVAAPVEALRDWAKSLNESNLKNTPPDFNYNELNSLAAIIRNSLNSVHHSLEREHQFLRNASHELRTPIAVIRSNVELLQKLNEKQPASDKHQQVTARIERAALNMGDLTETLLWLSRDNEPPPALQTVKLNQLIEQLVEELNYLLQGKAVTVKLDCAEFSTELPLTVCRIVLANLIRNAFQHTQNGSVSIQQIRELVCIRNINADCSAADSANDELGFGLGLKLTDKLVKQFHWPYHRQIETSGHLVEVLFSAAQNKQKK
ncbi:sensor histidine kinase [Psychromonas aquimarina]|uniref:sensor histidine kinase n=1 Tax=Psychromonas aquimarina TaxID=444919 RepID=UPI00041355C8|nr:HAMP domain-containing sensor histidine kinase [Psychromonas aquimarina]